MGPKDHTSFTSQEINITQNESNKHESSRNGVKVQKKQIQTEQSMHKGPRHHLLVPSQYVGGRPWVKVFQRM